MQEKEGAIIAATIRKSAEEMKRLCSGIDEETAAKRPADRWSPKEIISHLCGREGVGMLPAYRAFVEQDVPELDLHAEDPFFTGARARMTFVELLDLLGREYDRIADFTAGLSPDQLGRKAHIPAFRNAPMGEYPTLGQFLGVLGENHLEFHINHMKEILEALGAAVS